MLTNKKNREYIGTKTYGLMNRKNKFHFVTDYGNKKEHLSMKSRLKIYD